MEKGKFDLNCHERYNGTNSPWYVVNDCKSVHSMWAEIPFLVKQDPIEDCKWIAIGFYADYDHETGIGTSFIKLKKDHYRINKPDFDLMEE